MKKGYTRANSSGCLKTVDLGHAKVHQNQIGALFNRDLDGFSSVRRFDHIMPQLFEHRPEQNPAVVCVFNQ